MKFQFRLLFYIHVISILTSCSAQKMNKSIMNETPILKYLEEKYQSQFEILELHQLMNEANPDENAPFEIKCVNPIYFNRPFYVFAELKPKFRILEDQYPATLISIYFDQKLANQKEGNKTAVQDFALKFSSSSTKELAEINDLEGVEKAFELKENDFLYVYYSRVENEYAEAKLIPVIDRLIANIFEIANCTINLECNFYKEKHEAKLAAKDISYHPEAPFGKRYENEERIQFRWLGTFTPTSFEKKKNTGESMSKGMRKVSNFRFKE